MKLSDIACQNAKSNGKTQKPPDGQCLYLEITKDVNKPWRYKRLYNEAETRLSLGAYPEVTLYEDIKRRIIDYYELSTNGDKKPA